MSKKTEELRNKIDAIFDKNLTEVDNWNSAVFYSDKQKFINELLEAINYTRSCCKLKDEEVLSFDEWLDFHYERTEDELVYKIDRIYYNKEDLFIIYNRIKHNL